MSKPKENKHHPYCQGCIYAVFAGCEPVCDYFLMTKHRRPLPARRGLHGAHHGQGPASRR